MNANPPDPPLERIAPQLIRQAGNLTSPATRRWPVAAETPSLVQFVVLSMLLHFLVVIVFGDPERGGGGRLGGWRALPFAVTLRPPAQDRGSPFKAARGADEGLAGSAVARRAGVATNANGQAAPRRVESPPAEGRSGMTVVPPAAPSPPSQPVAYPAAEPAAPRDAPAAETLPHLDRGAPDVVDKAIDPRLESASPRAVPAATVPRVDLESPRKVEPEIAPAAQAPVQHEVPAPPLPRFDPVPPAKVERESIPRVETPAQGDALPETLPRFERAAPPKADRAVTPTVHPPAPRDVPAETLPRFEREAPQKVDKEQIPLAEPPAPRDLPAPTPTPPRVEREAPPQIEPQQAPPAEPPARREPPVAIPVQPPAPREAPAATVPHIEPPQAIERMIAPTVQPPAPRDAPAATTPRVDREVPRRVDAESPRPVQPPPRDAPGAEPLPRLRFGAPSDVDEAFTPRAPPPAPGDAPAAVLPSRTDLDATGKATREIGRSDARRGIVPLNLAPPKPPPESKLGQAIQKAAQPDCRDAYAGLGLLAIPFLLKDTVTDTGCRW